MQRIILHIDFDSFFASVEQFDHPELRGKPIGVTAANSRSAIIAASVEAKKYGVRGGSSSHDGFLVCPNLQLVPAHFPRYFAIAKKFLAICRLYSPYIEVFSIDELFMDVTQTATLFGGTEKLIEKVKAQITKDIGDCITVSVGVSYNKLLAKMASGLKKPNGVCIITPENVDSVYAQAALTDVCGIGFRIARRLQMLGITNLLKLRKLSYEKLLAEFGPHEAAFLQSVAFAKDETAVIHFGNAPQTKSVGRNYCLPQNQTNERIVLQNMFELCEEIAIKLRKLKKKARTVGIALSGSETISGRETVPFFMDNGKDIFEVCLFIMRKSGAWHENQYVRQISIWTSSLQDAYATTQSLFPEKQKEEKITAAIDAINEKFGDHTIRSGFLLYADKLTTVPNGFLADRWDRLQLTKLY